MITGKTIGLTRWTFVGKVMSLLFNMLSRLVIIFLPRSKHLLISWLQSPSAVILEPPKIVSLYFHCFPIYLPWSDGTRCHDLSFWMLSFTPTFSFSSFTFIKRLFSSSSLSAIRVVLFVYLRLLIFLLAILIPAIASSSLAFCMMYSAYAYHLPAMQETWVWFLGQEDPLEKQMATHSSILAWRIPWIKDPDRLQSTGSQKSYRT